MKKKDEQEPGKCPFHELQVASGETHQVTEDPAQTLTTNQGVPIADDQNSLRFGARGASLLEDFVLREKITHFDHERIPERVVHARGFGAKGYFQPYPAAAEHSVASFLRSEDVRTPVFVRFSTVAGSEGSPDCARDVRGFAVKFYTEEGNFDLVGNNIPVFFIQDAMKFPDLIHAAKPAPDRGFPQAQTAHDSFWDFASWNPESTHMLLWIMSDRTLPRSFRMMEGFGVHTFRMKAPSGQWNLVKFHFRPRLGSASLLWEEAVMINGADPDFHRRDLWNAIESGSFPEWEFSVQVFTEQQAEAFNFDVLDPTKLVPEELVPLTPLGRLVLNENVRDFFAETDQVAFCPAHLVPGFDFSSDPLLQGRVFSYLDTQLSRLGSPNFHELPVNRPRCPLRNFQRGGAMRSEVGEGRFAFEPSSAAGPRENPYLGFRSAPRLESGELGRSRSESFADHFSQARMFWLSMTEVEQDHIVDAFTFELSKVELRSIRERMVKNLSKVDDGLATRVGEGLGLVASVPDEVAATLPDMGQLSPSLSLVRKAPLSLEGRKLGLVLLDGASADKLQSLTHMLGGLGATLAKITPKIAGVRLDDGSVVEGDETVAGAPSVLFDYVGILSGAKLPQGLEPKLTEWLAHAYRHKKPILLGGEAVSGMLLSGPGVEEWTDGTSLEAFLAVCAKGRVWERADPALV